MTPKRLQMFTISSLAVLLSASGAMAQAPGLLPRLFHAADRCVACHNGIRRLGERIFPSGPTGAPR